MLKYTIIYLTKSKRESQNRHSHLSTVRSEAAHKTAKGWKIKAVYEDGKDVTQLFMGGF
jgi:hypothetical protein